MPNLRYPSQCSGTSGVRRQEPDKGKGTTPGAAATSGTLLTSTVTLSPTTLARLGKATCSGDEGHLSSSTQIPPACPHTDTQVEDQMNPVCIPGASTHIFIYQGEWAELWARLMTFKPSGAEVGGRESWHLFQTICSQSNHVSTPVFQAPWDQAGAVSSPIPYPPRPFIHPPLPALFLSFPFLLFK